MAKAFTQDTPPVEEVILHQIQYSCQTFLDGDALADMRLETRPDFVTNNLIASLRTGIWAEEVGKQSKNIYFKAPENWWQMFKKEYFPEWLKEKFPVKEKYHSRKVTMTVNIAYPKLPQRFHKGDYVQKVQWQEEIK